jgi:signal transduction histidine kinase
MNQEKRISYITSLITILIAGFFVTFMTVRLAINAEHSSLVKRATTIAAGFPPDVLSTVSGVKTDIALQSYLDLKTALVRIRRANQDVRFIYVLGQREGDVFFYADSEDSSSDDYSAPGDIYHEATQEVRDGFSTGVAFIEGPVSDRWGTWISGIAPLRDSNGEVAGLVGIDIAAYSYYRTIVVASAVPVLLTIITVILLAVGYHDARKNDEFLRIKSRFLSVASHELRSPLSGIVWGTESLLRHRDKLDEHTRQMIFRIHDSVVYMSETVNDILDTSRFNAVAENRVQREAVDLAALVRSVAGVLSLTGEQRDISVVFEPSFPERIPLVFDKEKIRRVFANVIGNALKYSTSGGVVTVSYKLQDDQHIISVADTGIGIPADEQKRIFTTYYRATNAQKHDARGTGMGLHFVKQLLELHGGRIWFESKEGEGTTFHVALKA